MELIFSDSAYFPFVLTSMYLGTFEDTNIMLIGRIRIGAGARSNR